MPSRELVTTNGVRVIVAGAPEPAPAPAPPAPPVVVRPPEEAVRQHDALMRRLHDEHAPFLKRVLAARTDLLPRSRNDIEQDVWVLFSREVWEKRMPPSVEGYLRECARNLIANHKRSRARQARRHAEAGLTPWAAPSPEREAQRAEENAKVLGYIRSLSPAEQETFCCLVKEGMTYEEAALALGRPLSTVLNRMARLRKKLRDRAEESERATKLGAALRSSPPPPPEE